MWIFHSLWIVFLETSWCFDLSSRSLGHVMFSFAGNAQEAGAGGRSGAAGIPLHGSRERKHHVTKASRWEVETSWSFKKYDPKWVKNSHFNIMNIGSNNSFSNGTMMFSIPTRRVGYSFQNKGANHVMQDWDRHSSVSQMKSPLGWWVWRVLFDACEFDADQLGASHCDAMPVWRATVWRVFPVWRVSVWRAVVWRILEWQSTARRTFYATRNDIVDEIVMCDIIMVIILCVIYFQILLRFSISIL